MNDKATQKLQKDSKTRNKRKERREAGQSTRALAIVLEEGEDPHLKIDLPENEKIKNRSKRKSR